MKLSLYKMTPQGIIATAIMISYAVSLYHPGCLPYWLTLFMTLPLGVLALCLHGDPPSTFEMLSEPFWVIGNAYIWGGIIGWMYGKALHRINRRQITPNNPALATGKPAPDR